MWTVIVFFVVSCVASATAIFRGNEASPGLGTYQVSLRNENKEHFCGASIISNQWLLTSAQCVHGLKSSKIHAVAGSHKLNKGGVKYGIDKFIHHERYNSQNKENDIALIKLNSKISFDSTTSSVLMPDNDAEAGMTALLTGWGITKRDSEDFSNNLQVLFYSTISNQLCQRFFPGYPIHPNNICLPVKFGKGACKGDEGSPLVSEGKLIGIVSRYSAICASRDPDIFTKVYPYRDWIKTHSGV